MNDTVESQHFRADNLSGGRPDKVEATAMPGAFTTFTFSPKAEDAEETHHIEQVLYDMRHGFRGSRIDYTQLEEAVKSIRKHGYGVRCPRLSPLSRPYTHLHVPSICLSALQRCRLCGRNAPSINRRLMIVCNKTCGGNTRYGGRAKHSAFDTSVECLIKLSKAYKYTNHRSMCTVCAESHCGEGLPEDCLSTPFSARSEKGVHGRNGRVGNKNRKAYKTVAGLFGYEEGAHELNCAKEDLKELVRNQKLILCKLTVVDARLFLSQG